jgi:hypothetical protein
MKNAPLGVSTGWWVRVTPCDACGERQWWLSSVPALGCNVCYILFMILMWISVTRCYKYHCCGCYSLLLNHCHVRHCQYVYICLSVCVICMIPWFYDSLCVCIIYWIMNVLCTVYKPKTCVWCQAVLNMVMSWDELHMLHRYRLAKNVKSKEWCAFPGCLSL